MPSPFKMNEPTQCLSIAMCDTMAKQPGINRLNFNTPSVKYGFHRHTENGMSDNKKPAINRYIKEMN